MANKAVTAAETAENREVAAAVSFLDRIGKAQRHSQDRALLLVAKTFARTAGRLLRTADQVLEETRQGRKETAELLDRLEARLASHG